MAMDLPPGFRFHPTDEEIITHYLTPKILNHGFTAPAMGAVDLNKCEPWDLPGKAKIHGGEKEWYFFCQRDRKYPTGMRTNRATESGYWKATGKDREICGGRGVVVGMKKTLVFYAGRAPKGEKTNWVMHEFRIEARSSLISILPQKDEWVVCRVFHKNGRPMAGGGISRFTDEIMSNGEDAQAPLLMDQADLFFPGDESFEEINWYNYSGGFDDDGMINCGMPGEMSWLNQDWRLATQSSAVPGRRCKAEQFSSDDVVAN